MSAERKARNLMFGAAILFCVNLFLLFLVFHQSAEAQTTIRAKFMYKVVKAGTDEQSLQTVVDLFARDGWELVTNSNDILIFKK